MYKAWNSIKKVPFCFWRSSVKFQGHTAKNCPFLPKLGVSGLKLQFEFTNGYEMMQKALSSVKEVPNCFLGSFIKFQSNTGRKIYDLNPIWVRLLGPLQLSNPSDLPCLLKLDDTRGPFSNAEVIFKCSFLYGNIFITYHQTFLKILFLIRHLCLMSVIIHSGTGL